jgi:hypothetical protein
MKIYFILTIFSCILTFAQALGTCYCTDGYIFTPCPNQIQCYHFCSDNHIAMSKFVSQ